MATHDELTGAGITTREAARLTTTSRATAARRAKAREVAVPLDQADPVNKLSCAEREFVLGALDSALCGQQGSEPDEQVDRRGDRASRCCVDSGSPFRSDGADRR